MCGVSGLAQELAENAHHGESNERQNSQGADTDLFSSLSGVSCRSRDVFHVVSSGPLGSSVQGSHVVKVLSFVNVHPVVDLSDNWVSVIGV